MDFISKYPNQFKILKQNKTKNLNHPSFWNGNMIFQRVQFVIIVKKNPDFAGFF